MTKYPVCGMQVDEQMAIASAVYQGKTYYFCSKACQQTFEKAPEKSPNNAGSQGHASVTPPMTSADNCSIAEY